MLKKIVACILSASVAFQVTGQPAFSADYDVSFEEHVVAGLENFDDEIDITSFVLENGWSLTEANDKFMEVLENNPQVFYVNPEIVTRLSGTVKYPRYDYVKIDYSFSKSLYPKKKAQFEAAADNALENISNSMSDVEKALALHDYLVLNTVYDSAKPFKGRRTSFDALGNRLALCLGYAMAYNYLLSRVGIEGRIVRSEAMNHAWNYVKIGKSWYHVDVTNDDPLMNGKIDKHGQVSHKLFLLSDTAIRKAGHKAWDVRGLPPASNTVYDNLFFRDVESKMVYLNGYWYYIKLDESSPSYNNNYEKNPSEKPYYTTYSDIYRYSFKHNALKKIYAFDSTWFVWGKENTKTKSWWSGSYASIDEYNGLLYFNTAKSIRAIDPKTAKISSTFTPKNAVGYIYGMTIDGKRITYNQKRSPGDANSLKTVKLGS